MYFDYYENRYCVNCDWLQYSVLTNQLEPEILCPEGYRVELCQGNNIFECRAIVYDSRGAKFLTLLWKPYSKVLQPNLMTVQVSNEFLYLPYGMGIQWSMEVVQQICECTFNGIGRLDVCIDFEGSEQRTRFLRHLNSNHYYVQHKSEGATWWHTTTVGDHKRRQLHCMNWGSQQSEIKVKVYNKSREQGLVGGEEPEKPWIVNDWRQAGMDVHNVWRLEFALTGAGQLRYKGERLLLSNVQDCQWLLDVACEMYWTKFVCRKNQGKRSGHHNNDDRVHLLRFPQRSAGLSWAAPASRDGEVPAAITLLRSLMRQVDNPALMATHESFTDYASTILNLVRLHRLDAYFRRVWETDAESYMNELSTHVGGGVRHCALSPNRLSE